MPHIAPSYTLAQALIAEGLVPKESSDIEILLPVDGAVMLSYRVYVTEVDLIKLGRAFTAAGTNSVGGN